MKSEFDEKSVDVNEDVADMAEAIVRVADVGKDLLNSGLTQDALITLLRRKIGEANCTRQDVYKVLVALPRLKDYVSH